MNRLDEIIAFKRKEVDELKKTHPVKLLERNPLYSWRPVSLASRLHKNPEAVIITEIKRRSPSKGILNERISIERIARGYVEAGAGAISILTDNNFFGGSNEDLISARHQVHCPVLRKDFIIDEYQVIETKAIGADVILLIASALDTSQIRSLSKLAHDLGLEVLMEIHREDDLVTAFEESDPDIIGVNNRDLKTFKVSLETSRSLAGSLPMDFPKISESGIETPEEIIDLKNHGYSGFLMGHTFMQRSHPEVVAMNFISEVRKLETAV